MLALKEKCGKGLQRLSRAEREGAPGADRVTGEEGEAGAGSRRPSGRAGGGPAQSQAFLLEASAPTEVRSHGRPELDKGEQDWKKYERKT